MQFLGYKVGQPEWVSPMRLSDLALKAQTIYSSPSRIKKKKNFGLLWGLELGFPSVKGLRPLTKPLGHDIYYAIMS
jgi:hypothetical protein